MLPIWIALAAQAIDITPITRAQPQLHTPDAIAPAVLPYLSCLYASRGLPLLRGSDGNQIEYDKSGGNCVAARRKAEADAIKLLEGKSVPGSVSATAFVDNALSEMDAYVASLPVRHSDTPRRLSVVGVPITIEDEVKPAYDRYEQCLKTQASDTPFTVETILSVFQQAIAICRSVRDAAVAEAEGALVKKGWDPPTRARAAENTFSDADKSWLAMAIQFRDSLMARLSEQAKTKSKRSH